MRRNPLISDLLHRIEFIEKAGTGIRRIREEAQARRCPEPTFEADSFVTVTFRPDPEVRAPIRKVVSEPTLIRKKGFLVHHGTARSDSDIVEFIRAERDARSRHIAGDTTD